MAKLFHCCSLSEKIIRISSVLYEGQSSKYKVCPVSKSVLIQKRSTRPRQSVLPLRFGNPSSIADMEVYQVSEEPSQDSVKTHFSLPGILLYIIRAFKILFFGKLCSAKITSLSPIIFSYITDRHSSKNLEKVTLAITILLYEKRIDLRQLLQMNHICTTFPFLIPIVFNIDSISIKF